MTAYIGWQYGFQTGVWQVWYPLGSILPTGGGGFSWERTRIELDRQRRYKISRQEEIKLEAKQNELRLKEKQAELEALELRRLEALADQFLQLQLIELLKQMQLLELEQQRLESLLLLFIREEEEILFIMEYYHSLSSMFRLAGVA